MNLDSSVDIVTGWMAEVILPAGAKYFSLLHNVQASPGADPAPCTIGTRALYPGVKRLESKDDHSHLSSAEVKNGGAIQPVPHMSSYPSV
jgi:hypothetical protein